MKKSVRGLVVFGVACFFVFGAAQGNEVKKRTVTADPHATLSQSEFASALDRVEPILLRVTGVTATLPKVPSGPGPAKRSDIVARLDKLFEAFRPVFKFTPRRVKYDPKTIALPTTHPQRAALEKMIKWGFINKAGVLVTSKSESVPLGEFAEVLAQFAMRTADVTHRPDPKFSPAINGNGPMGGGG